MILTHTPNVYMHHPKKAAAIKNAISVCTINQYSEGAKKAAVGEKWLTFLPLYFPGPVALNTKYPGIHPTVNIKTIP